MLFSLGLSAQKFTNTGKEFWVGYGNNYLFSQGTTVNQQQMVLYLGAGSQTAHVTVTVHGTTWVRNYTIAPNAVQISDLMPKAGAEDCRILGEGLYSKGIHIESDVPISAFVHTYGVYSSGGTMLLPVESYSYSYTSVNSEQSGNDSYCWFYVLADEDNTRVRITPSRATAGGKNQNIAFEVTLAKGQLYNVMGAMSGGNSADLSGSKVQSIPGADGRCHPVAMFSGSSRTYVCSGSDPLNSGSDYCMQQVFPNNAWGAKFIVALTSRSTGAAQLNNNKLRAYIREAGTVVRKNGAIISGLINNSYYDFLSTSSDVITSTKPILLAQFIPSANGCGSQGLGDPEMFCLTPAEQAINEVSFFSSSREAIDVNYLTMVIPQAGIASLKIDGSNTYDHSYPHPNAPGYTVVVKKFPVPDMQHTVKSDSAFTAIVYGLGQFESYGYNAGCNISNLEALVQLKNEYATIFTDYTCLKTAFRPVLKTVYKPSSILWKLSTVTGMSPNSDVSLTNPVPNDSVTEPGRKYYLFYLPGNYTFSNTGTYTIPVTLTNLLIENCTYSINTSLDVVVKPAPVADFSVAAKACAGDTVRFTDASPLPALIKRWNWTFGDGGIDSIQHPNRQYIAAGSYNIKLQIIKKEDGCVGDTIKPITVNALPVVDFNLPALICMPGGKAIFANRSSIPGNAVLQYNWSFGDGGVSNDKDPQYVYAAAGSYTVTLKAVSAAGCSDTATKLLNAFKAKPVAAFGISDTLCLGADIHFTDSSISAGNITRYTWLFGDGTNSIAASPKKTYSAAGDYTVQLFIQDNSGCSSDTIKKVLHIYDKPNISAGPDMTTMAAVPVQLKANAGPGITQFSWSPASLLNDASVLQPTATLMKDQQYVLTAAGPGNCYAADSVFIKVIQAITNIPNVFSPNGDGINDTWQITGLAGFPDARLTVFDRYGRMVFETSGYKTPWNGMDKKGPLPVATYYYILQPYGNEHGRITGSVTIIK